MISGGTDCKAVEIPDYRKWSRFEVGISASGDLPELQALTARLQAQGFPVGIGPANPADCARHRVFTTRRWLKLVRDSMYYLGGHEV